MKKVSTVFQYSKNNCFPLFFFFSNNCWKINLLQQTKKISIEKRHEPFDRKAWLVSTLFYNICNVLEPIQINSDWESDYSDLELQASIDHNAAPPSIADFPNHIINSIDFPNHIYYLKGFLYKHSHNHYCNLIMQIF